VNNIAIGAAYAKYKYRNEINKIAIFDFDLHHGNGTEEIVQMLNSKIFEKKFCYDKLCELKTRNFKQINWVDFDDAKNVLYISTHIYEKENEKENNFYPFSGGVESNTDKKSPIYPGGIYNIPLIITKDKKNFTREEYRNIIKTKVIPRLYEFKPDLIFLSAGFDCHENEIINQNYINLNEFDFSFITQQMQFVANKFCKGRLISILEGGYNNNAGVTSPFIQSVFTHARFLNLSLNMFQISDIKLTGIKRQPQNIDDNDNKPEKNDNEINN
jgi:acetoin utilization deacetylase AcuC-like enzyme